MASYHRTKAGLVEELAEVFSVRKLGSRQAAAAAARLFAKGKRAEGFQVTKHYSGEFDAYYVGYWRGDE